MIKIILSVLIFCFIGVPGTESGVFAGDEVINSGFELDTDNDKRPDSWDISKSKGVKAFLNVGKGHSGLRSAKLVCRKVDAKDTISSNVMLYQHGRIKLRKGVIYKLSFWAKHSGLKSRVLHVGLRDLKKRRSCDLYTMFRLSIEQNIWREYTYYFRSSKECKNRNRLQFWFKEKGILWIDDISFMPIDRTHFTPKNIIGTGRKNLIPNSSFECGSDGWGSFSLSKLPWGGLSRLVGQIDHSQAKKGKASMKIAVSSEIIPTYHFDYFKLVNKKNYDPLLGNIGWIKVKKGKEYTLSMYLKSQQYELPVTIGIKEFMGGVKTHTVQISDKWKRYAFRIIPRSDYCFVVAGPDPDKSPLRSETLWIDAVQLEEGKEPTDYKPSADVEIGISTGRPENIFTTGEQTQLMISIKNSTDIPQKVLCDIKRYDFFDKLNGTESFSRVVEKDTILNEIIDLDIQAPGFFKIEINLRWKEKQTKKKIRMAIIPQYKSNNSVFGINHAYGWDSLLESCRKAGITWVRDWSLKWNEIEPQRGKFDFSKTDIGLERIKNNNLNILGLLPFPSNEWSSSSVNVEADSIDSIKKRVAFAPKKEEEFDNYVKETVKHNKNNIQHWQIFNEPITTSYSLPEKYGYSPAEYYYWIREAFRSVKEIDPESKVLIGLNGYDQHRLDVFESLFKLGVMKFCDIITVHVYPRLYPPESFEAPVRNLVSLMEKYHDKKPIWITEHGYYCNGDPETEPDIVQKYLTPLEDEKTQASYTIRFATIQLANGVEKIIFHAGVSPGLNRKNIQGIFFDYGGVPRKIYPAVAAFANMISPETNFVKKMNFNKDILAYLFKKNKNYILIIWKSESREKIRIVLGNKRIKAENIVLSPIMGNEIELTSYPIYITTNQLSLKDFIDNIHIRTKNKESALDLM